MRILITGVTGFVGGHLARALLARGSLELYGIALNSAFSSDNANVAKQLRLVRADLCDQPAVESILRDARPDWIMHLAGYADAGKSFQEPEAAWDGNLTATRRLYDAARAYGGSPRILFVGSGMVYGDAAGSNGLIDERTELRPDSPYAASKAAADLMSFQYTRTHGMAIIRARPFNHAGPGQAPVYAISSFARQAVLIEQGKQEPVIRAGNLDAQRDFTDVRNVVAGYIRLMEQGRPGEAYNIASGRTVTIRSILEHVRQVSRTPLEFQSDPRLVRAIETAVPQVSIAAIRDAVGWSPTIPLSQTIADTLDYWRKQS